MEFLALGGAIPSAMFPYKKYSEWWTVGFLEFLRDSK